MKFRMYNLGGGMDVSTNPFMTPDTSFSLLLNCNCDENGAISKDGGYTFDGIPFVSANNVDLLCDYVGLNGSHQNIAVVGNILYKREQNSSQWVVVTYTGNQKCSAVNYLNKLYIARPGQSLSAWNGSTVSPVSSGTESVTISGKYLALVGEHMYLANLGSPFTSNMVVYTQPDSDQFYNPLEEGHSTYETTNNYIKVVGSITGITGYRGALLIFTEDALWQYNYLTGENPKIIAKTGCVAHDTIHEIDGILYWTSRQGVYRFDGNSMPVLISLPLLNWNIDSPWRLINPSHFPMFSAIAYEGKYYLYTGTPVAPYTGMTSVLQHVVFVYDTRRNTWSIYDEHNALSWGVLRRLGSDTLCFGDSQGKIWKRGFSYSHDLNPISMIIRTKQFEFDEPEQEKFLTNFICSYRAENVGSSYINVSIATNGQNDYQPVLSATSPTKLPSKEVDGYRFERVTMSGKRGHTISYSFEDNGNGYGLTLLGFTQEYQLRNLNKNLTTHD